MVWLIEFLVFYYLHAFFEDWKTVKEYRSSTRVIECCGHHFWLVSASDVFVFSVLLDLDLLCVATYWTTIKMGQFDFSFDLFLRNFSLFFGTLEVNKTHNILWAISVTKIVKSRGFCYISWIYSTVTECFPFPVYFITKSKRIQWSVKIGVLSTGLRITV